MLRLRHYENTLHRFPVQQLEFGSIFHIKAGGMGHDPIEKSGTFSVKRVVSPFFLGYPPQPQPCFQSRYISKRDFRRMLQVTVHHCHRISACLCKARPQLLASFLKFLEKCTPVTFLSSLILFLWLPRSRQRNRHLPGLVHNGSRPAPGLSESPAGFLHHRFLVTGRQNYR